VARLLTVRVNGGVVTEPKDEVPLKKLTLVTVPPVAVAFAETLTSAGAEKTAPSGGLIIATETEIGATTVMFTTDEVAETPEAVATADSEYEPAARLLKVRVNGGVVTEPKDEVPLKKLTLVTVPPVAVASAAMLTSAGAVKTAPSGGLVIVTETEVGATTLMSTTDEVAETPEAVATAVSEYESAGKLLSVRLNGGVETAPKGEVPLKKVTLVTVPPVAVASAAMLISAGAVKTVPSSGLVILTETEIGATTVMFTTEEVLESPEAVATAVSE
jgi:hypothetical protein